VSAWREQVELCVCVDVLLLLVTGNSAAGLHLHFFEHTVS
jgi:hypothetical protein